MSSTAVSVCHCLKIIPLSHISGYARILTKIVMSLQDEPIDMQAVPGSVKISTTEGEGKIKKKITFERSNISGEDADLLEMYKVLRLVATYVDESGRERVSGSPDYPLSLDYYTDEGVFNVTLQGEDLNPDGFLA